MGGAYSGLADAYFQAGDISQALTNHKRAIELEPKNALLYSNRGYLYSRINEFSKALADCNKAISLNPKLVYAYGSRGHLYFLMQKYEDALADFNKAIKIKFTHKFAIVGQSLCQHAIGNINEAIKLWQSVIELDPKYINVEKLVRDYHPAQEFVEAAREIVADLNNEHRNSTEKEN